MEQFKVGIPLFVYGDISTTTQKLFTCLVELQKSARIKRLLFFDTLNCLDPHFIASSQIQPQQLFKNIYCARTERPYDLWARLNTSEKFIRNFKIEAIIIPSLTYIFKDSEKEEIRPLLSHILRKINHLTRKYNLITIIGNNPHSEEQITIASNYLLYQQTMVI